MYTRRILRAAMAMTATAMLIACGGSGDSSEDAGNNNQQQQTQTVTAVPSLGRVEGATVRVYQADDATLLGEAEIDTDGTVSIEVAGDYEGPIILELVGDDESTYYDEAAGTMLSTGPGELLHAIVPAGTTSAAITALTEIAYRRAIAQEDLLSDAGIADSNEGVRRALAPELTSLLTPPLVFDADTGAGALGDNATGRYALKLAALARLGATDAQPAVTVARQLAQDIVDGELDGDADGEPIEGLVYAPMSFVNDMERELADFANAFGDSDLISAVGDYPRIETVIEGPSAPDGGSDDSDSGNNGSGTSGLTPNGDGSALAGENGATGTVAGTAFTFTGSADGFLDVSWTILPGDGTGLFSALQDAITRWEVRNIEPEVGTQNCGAGGEPPSIFLALAGTPYLSDECTIEVDVVSDSEVEGRFAARLLDAAGNEFGAVTDGYFRLRTGADGDSGDSSGDSGGEGDNAGEWTLTITGTSTANGIATQVPAVEVPGTTPPATGDEQAIEQAIIGNSSNQSGNVDRINFDVVSASDSEVVIEAQLAITQQGFTIEQDLTYTWTLDQ